MFITLFSKGFLSLSSHSLCLCLTFVSFLPSLQPLYPCQPPLSGILNSGNHLLSNIMTLPLTASSRQLWPSSVYLTDFLFHCLFASLIHLELCAETREEKNAPPKQTKTAKWSFHSEFVLLDSNRNVKTLGFCSVEKWYDQREE